MAFTIGAILGIVCGFVLGLLSARRGTTSDLSIRARRIDDNIDELGDTESAVASGIATVEGQLAISIDTVSGMGDQIQRAKDIVARIRERGKQDNP